MFNLVNIIVVVAALVVIIAGIFANAWQAGIVLAVIIITTLVLYRNGVITIPAQTEERLRGYAINVVEVVAVVAIVSLVFGIWSPDIKASYDRWSGNQKQVLANHFDKSSLKSEAEVGVIGTLPEETVVYNSRMQAVWKMPAGEEVMAANLDGHPKSQKFEGMTEVMLRNKYGDFAKGNGNVVFVPSRKINWNR